MPLEWARLIAENPGSAVILIIATAMFMFNMGIVLSSFRYMQINMVTKKDLKIAMLELKVMFDDIYVSKKEWNIIERKKV